MKPSEIRMLIDHHRAMDLDRFVRFQQREEGGFYWVRASHVSELIEHIEGERIFTTLYVPSGWNPTVEMTPQQVIELLFGDGEALK